MRSPVCYKHCLNRRWYSQLTGPIRALQLGLVILLLSACGDPPSLKPLAAQAVILAFGDSLTHGTGAEPSQAYPAVLAERIGRKVVNAGIPGEISEYGLKRLRRELDRVHPALVILIHAGNDLLQRRSKHAAAKNLLAMIDLIRASGAQVVMVGVPDFGLFLHTAKLYREVAEQRGVPIDKDILPALLSDQNKKSDTVHPNAEGYRELALAVEALLRENGALP